MSTISHKYLEKLRKEVTDLDNWLGSTQPAEDGNARPEDLKNLYGKGYSVFQKTLALYQTTLDTETEQEDFEQLRQEVAKFDYWLSTEVTSPDIAELKNIFTRANAIYLKALSLYRHAAQEVEGPQEIGGEEHASISRS
ncbi:MAG TPA: hypothetical protein VH186_29310 [Chloroflexia bacterium]|nr:hypothetical protein [Chloroflexia bacterium]